MNILRFWFISNVDRPVPDQGTLFNIPIKAFQILTTMKKMIFKE